MLLLAIDTATEACSCALLTGADSYVEYTVAPQGHAELLLPMVAKVLAKAGGTLGELDLLAVGVGPGSFTGLRIAVGTAQGLGYALDCPIVPISSLQILAQGAARQFGAKRALCVFDARMGQVYAGTFELDGDGLMQACSPEQVCAPDAVFNPFTAEWFGIGSGWSVCRLPLSASADMPPAKIVTNIYPNARDALALGVRASALGKQVVAADLRPVYLRDHVAQTLEERRRSKSAE